LRSKKSELRDIDMLISLYTLSIQVENKTSLVGIQNDSAHPEASKKIKTTPPYVKNSISDAILAGDEHS
jgi:hypothetical protein